MRCSSCARHYKCQSVRKLVNTPRIPQMQPRAYVGCRARLRELAALLRALDVENGGHTAAADLVLLSASTQTWFAAEREYKVHTLACAHAANLPHIMSRCDVSICLIALTQVWLLIDSRCRLGFGALLTRRCCQAPRNVSMRGCCRASHPHRYSSTLET